MAGDVKIRTSLDGVSQVTSGFKQIESSLDKMSQGFTRVGKSLSLAITTPLVGLAAAASKAAADQEAALKKIEAVIKATGGAAGQTTQDLQKMASSLQRATGIADDDINALQARLLTFRNITGDVFERTTQAAVDFAAVMGTDAQSAAVMLGRALNDPTQGMGMLARAGISLTDALKAQIVELAESGKLLEAQNLLLNEITKSTGGAAAAMRDTFGGAVKALRTEVGELFEVFGDDLNSIIRPVIEQLITFVRQLQMASPETREFIIKIGALAAVFPPLLIGIGLTVSAIRSLGGSMLLLGKAVLPVTAAYLLLQEAYEGWLALKDPKRLGINLLERELDAARELAKAYREQAEVAAKRGLKSEAQEFTRRLAEQTEEVERQEQAIERLRGKLGIDAGGEKKSWLATIAGDIKETLSSLASMAGIDVSGVTELIDSLLVGFERVRSLAGGGLLAEIVGTEEDEFQVMSRITRVHDAMAKANVALLDSFNQTNTKRREQASQLLEFEMKLRKVSEKELIEHYNAEMEKIRANSKDKEKISQEEFKTRQKIAALSSSMLDKELKQRQFSVLTIAEQRKELETLRVKYVQMGRDGEGAVADLDEKMEDLQLQLEQRTFSFGARRAVANYFDELTNAGARAGQFLATSFKSLEDVLTNFFMTGKLSFASFFEAITAGVARLLAQDVIGTLGQVLGLPGAGSLSGGGGGGVIGGLLGGVGGFLGNLFGGGGGGGAGFFSGMGSAISDAVSSVGDFISNIFSFAGGGAVIDLAGPGPGGDNILAFLDREEYVIRPEAAKKLGRRRLDVLNAGHLPRFQSGGGVGAGGEGSGGGGPGGESDVGGPGGGFGGGEQGGGVSMGAEAPGAMGSLGGPVGGAETGGGSIAGAIGNAIADAIDAIGRALGSIFGGTPGTLSGNLMGSFESELPGLADTMEETSLTQPFSQVLKNFFAGPLTVDPVTGQLQRSFLHSGLIDGLMSLVSMAMPVPGLAGLAVKTGLGVAARTAIASGLGSYPEGVTATGARPGISGQIANAVARGIATGQREGNIAGSVASELGGFAAGLFGGPGLGGFGGPGGPGGGPGPMAGFGEALGAVMTAAVATQSPLVAEAGAMSNAAAGVRGSLGDSWAKVVGVANDIMGGVPSFDIGGSRVFTEPSLISVAEHGPEFVNARPMASGGSRDGGGTLVVRLGAGAVIDDMSFYSFTRRLRKEFVRRQSRGF